MTNRPGLDADRLIIERLEFQGYCGITPAERDTAQPLALDLELTLAKASPPGLTPQTDDLTQTVDYVGVAERLIKVGTSERVSLLETLAERLSAMLFAEFPVTGVRLWIRKLAPPIAGVRGSAGIRIERTREAQSPEPRPARFLVEQLHQLPKGAALDIATGRGRNALYLAMHGFVVEGVDRDKEALAWLAETARQRNLTNLTVRCLDLEADGDLPPDLPKDQYDVILVFFYLHRPLFPAILQVLRPGGVLVYETFLIDNHLRHQHPRRREFCLAHNELLRLTSGLRVLHYAEGEHEDLHSDRPAFTARLLARKE